jgi:protein-S-isoprenylcysteine O-methyltransferase Ste14
VSLGSTERPSPDVPSPWDRGILVRNPAVRTGATLCESAALNGCIFPDGGHGRVVEIVIFLAGSAGVLAVSWRTLRVPRAHGRMRLLAFECLLALVLLQARRWFVRPLAPHQLVSWPLLALSALLAVHGFDLLRRHGRPDAAHGKSSDLGFERTSVLVTSGAYQWIRHPLYASGVLAAWGAYFKGASWTGAALAAAATILLAATAQAEEAENFEKFGTAYAEYARRTWRFIPFVY